MSLKFDVPGAVHFGKLIRIQSYCDMSVGVLVKAPVRQKEPPKLSSKKMRKTFCHRGGNTGGVSQHHSLRKRLEWKLGEERGNVLGKKTRGRKH